MATGTNGIATVNDLVVGKNLNPPLGYASNQCPTKTVILSMGGSVPSTYASNQLVKYSDVSIAGLFINNTVVLVNFGTTQIYSITIEFKNTVTGDSASVNTGGGFSNGNSRILQLSEYIYAEGDGGLYISAVIINGASLNSSQIASKFNLRIGSSSTSGNLPRPSTWGNNLLWTYYFINRTSIPLSQIQVDINW